MLCSYTHFKGSSSFWHVAPSAVVLAAGHSAVAAPSQVLAFLKALHQLLRCWSPEDDQGGSDPDLWASRRHPPLQHDEGKVCTAPSYHLCVSAAGQKSTSHQTRLWRNLPRSVPGRADTAGPVWKDRYTVQHHSTTDHTNLQTETHRDPHLSLGWDGAEPQGRNQFHHQHHTRWKHWWLPRCVKMISGTFLSGVVQIVNMFY